MCICVADFILPLPAERFVLGAANKIQESMRRVAHFQAQCIDGLGQFGA